MKTENKTIIKTSVITNWPSDQEFRDNETNLNKDLTKRLKPYIKKYPLLKDANFNLHISSTEVYALHTLVITFNTNHNIIEDLELMKNLNTTFKDILAELLDLSSRISHNIQGSTSYPGQYSFTLIYTAIEEF